MSADTVEASPQNHLPTDAPQETPQAAVPREDDPRYLPPGVYLSVILRADPPQDGWHNQWRLGFKIIHSKHGGKWASGFFPWEPTPNNKTGRLMRTILGERMNAAKFSVNMLVSMPVGIRVETREKNGRYYANVVDFVPLEMKHLRIIWSEYIKEKYTKMRPKHGAEKVHDKTDIPF